MLLCAYHVCMFPPYHTCALVLVPKLATAADEPAVAPRTIHGRLGPPLYYQHSHSTLHTKPPALLGGSGECSADEEIAIGRRFSMADDVRSYTMDHGTDSEFVGDSPGGGCTCLHGFVKDKLLTFGYLWQRAFSYCNKCRLDPCQAHHYRRCARLSCRHTLLSL